MKFIICLVFWFLLASELSAQDTSEVYNNVYTYIDTSDQIKAEIKKLIDNKRDWRQIKKAKPVNLIISPKTYNMYSFYIWSDLSIIPNELKIDSSYVSDKKSYFVVREDLDRLQSTNLKSMFMAFFSFVYDDILVVQIRKLDTIDQLSVLTPHSWGAVLELLIKYDHDLKKIATVIPYKFHIN